MTKPTVNRGQQGGNTATIKRILASHREAIVICADLDADGENTISAYTKLLTGGPLSRYLAALLESLNEISDEKDHSNPFEAETTVGPQADHS